MGLKLMGRLFGDMLKVVYTMGKMGMSRFMAFSCFLLINPVFNIVINSYQHGKFGVSLRSLFAPLEHSTISWRLEKD
jgi:hypothetical protein